MSNLTPLATRLTDAQLVLLSAAARRDDGLVVLTDVHPSVARTIAALLKKQLLAELLVQRRQPNWRQDENGKLVGLKITNVGRTAIGVEASEANKGQAAPPTIEATRPGTKQAVVIGLLVRPSGASLKDLIEATGWLPHTTRAALSVLRKKGFELASEKPDGAERRYSIPVPAQASAA